MSKTNVVLTIPVTSPKLVVKNKKPVRSSN